MIKVLFSKNKAMPSILIRWATKDRQSKLADTPSHVSIEFFGLIVLESTMKDGVKLTASSYFRKYNQIIHEHNTEIPSTQEYLADILAKFYGLKYDYAGAIYMGLFKTLNRVFGVDIPKKNPYNSRKRHYCNELYLELIGDRIEMSSPLDILKALRGY